MKQNRFARRRAPRTDAAGRAQRLADFDRSGLSGADFARQRGLNYTTFCAWRRRRNQAQVAPALVEVELPPPAAPPEAALVLEMGAARLRLVSAAQLPLAARLLQLFREGRPC